MSRLLYSLPNEVLAMITDCLDSEADIGSLALTCSQFLPIFSFTISRQNTKYYQTELLFWASYYGMLGVAKEALAAGAHTDMVLQEIVSSYTPHFQNIRTSLLPISNGFASHKKKAWYLSIMEEMAEYTPLTVAASQGLMGVASVLIDYGADLNPSSKIETRRILPIAAAIENDRARMIKFLAGLQRKTLDALNSERIGIVTNAARWGRLEAIEYLLPMMKNPDRLTIGSNSALMYAIKQKRLDIVKVLIDSCKIKVNAKDPDGNTPIALAIRAGSKEMVDLLLKVKDININLPNKAKDTPLYRAFNKGKLDIITALIDSGKLDICAISIFREACESNAPIQIIEAVLAMNCFKKHTRCADGYNIMHVVADVGHEEALKLILQRNDINIDVNATTTDGLTPLHRALGTRFIDCVELLINAGANVKIPDVTGTTVLHVAATKSSMETMEFLLDQGADINACTDEGSTALDMASRKGANKIVELLLERGADWTIADNRGLTALHYACTTRYKWTIDAILKVVPHAHAILRSGSTPLHQASELGYSVSVQSLLKKGADPISKAPDDTSALFKACLKGRAIVARILVKSGADPNEILPTGSSLLHLVCKQGDLRTCQVLVKAGALIDNQDGNDDKETALYAATTKGSAPVVEYLLKQGANPGLVAGEDLMTPLHEICSNSNGSSSRHDILEDLLLYRSPVNQLTKGGKTALDLAYELPVSDTMIATLLNHGAMTSMEIESGH